MMFSCAQFWRVLNIWMRGSGRGLAPSIIYALVHQLIFPDVASLGWRPHLWHFSSHCTDNDWPIVDTRRHPFGRGVDWVQWSEWFAPSQWETAERKQRIRPTESIPMLGTTWRRKEPRLPTAMGLTAISNTESLPQADYYSWDVCPSPLSGYFRHGRQQKYLIRFGLSIFQIVTLSFVR